MIEPVENMRSALTDANYETQSVSSVAVHREALDGVSPESRWVRPWQIFRLERERQRANNFVIPGILALVVFLAAPSFPLSWWMYVPVMGWSMWRLRNEIARHDVLLVASLVVWAIAAEWLTPGGPKEWNSLLGYWLPHVSTYLLACAVVRNASRFMLHVCLAASLLIVCVFLGFNYLGIDLHQALPSYKGDKAGDLAFTVYNGGAERFRAFYGEASTLSASLVVLVTLVLISSRALPRRGFWSGYRMLLLAMSGAALCSLLVILSKAGLLILLAGLIGAGAAMIRQRPSRKWLVAPVIGAFVVLGGTLAAALAPESMRSYLQTEKVAAMDALEGGRTAHGGTQSRLDHWFLTLDCVTRYPLGSGTVGVRETYDNPRWFNPNSEMERRIPDGVYGLMNQWANLAAQTGIFGVFAVSMIIRLHLKRRGTPAIRCLVGAQLVAFLFCVETFPFFILIVLAGAVATAYASDANS